MKQVQVRQGDVFLRAVRMRDPLAGAQVTDDRGRVILAYGEVTEHAHEVVPSDTAIADATPPAMLIEEPGGKRFLFVNAPCSLVHQEHGTIALMPGCYEVVRQREYSPEAIRTIAD